MIKEEDTYKLIFKSKIIALPPNIDLTYGIDQSILTQLTSNKYYKVKSYVSKEVFELFIKNWTDGEIPLIDEDNIDEYEKLSQEFGRMKNLIRIFKQKSIKNSNLALQQKILQASKVYQRLTNLLNENVLKYKEIINFLFNNEDINNFSTFLSLKNQLLDKCLSNDLKGIKKLVQQKYIINDIQYTINKDSKTAKVVHRIKNMVTVTIPKSITVNSEELIITEITENSSSISSSVRNFNFVPDSKVRLIGRSVFSGSKLQSLSIPSSVEELQDGWYFGLDDLTEIKIGAKNKNFMIYDRNLLLKKSNPKSDIFDILIFACKNIENATIPPFVKVIDKFAFRNCQRLKSVNFTNKSKLKMIKSRAFLVSSVKSLSLPSSVLILKKNWSARMNKLVDIEIIETGQKNIKYYDNKYILGKSDIYSDNFDVILFARRDIEVADIPSFITQIGPNAFSCCKQLKQVIFEPDTKLEIIDKSSFEESSIESIKIPSTVTTIGKNAFSKCYKLLNFNFDENSQLKQIGEYSFVFDSFEKIIIPPQVKEIVSNTFFASSNIKSVEFAPNSKLQRIFSNAFMGSSIDSLTLPSSAILKYNWCDNIENLKYIKIIDNETRNITYYDDKFILGKSNLNSDVFDVLLFARRDIEEADIPSFIKRIGPCAFYYCKQLKRVSFAPDSELKVIFGQAFMFSSIKSIKIPNTVNEIGYGAFAQCKKLSYCELPKNPEFRFIPSILFLNSGLVRITIPSSVTHIMGSAFSSCKNLQRVEFEINSNLKIIDQSAFCLCKSIFDICIPKHVTDIREKAFYNAENLTYVTFEEKSELKIIEDDAFSGTSIPFFSIPPSVMYIGSAFCISRKLQSIEIPENSKLHSLHIKICSQFFWEDGVFFLVPKIHKKILKYDSEKRVEEDGL